RFLEFLLRRFPSSRAMLGRADREASARPMLPQPLPRAANDPVGRHCPFPDPARSFFESFFVTPALAGRCKNWVARMTLERESDSCAEAAGGIDARFGPTHG